MALKKLIDSLNSLFPPAELLKHYLRPGVWGEGYCDKNETLDLRGGGAISMASRPLLSTF